MLEDNLRAISKRQYVYQILKLVCGCMKALLNQKDDFGRQDHMLNLPYLRAINERLLRITSALAGAMDCVPKVDFFMFDEPSSYLEVRKQLTHTILLKYSSDRVQHAACRRNCHEDLTEFGTAQFWIFASLSGSALTSHDLALPERYN
ncbi:ATP-binding cassette sub- E member 1 [Clonorchis sinensis]|uniref:ATP-binding cassette sub- E member 1 n=1 Tax=Clonorchis sinensis TaxID=79923 RepID=A0A419QG22_CLOSI|nr:ATP-binding cassette sub- E member 1 [Clonorchis sinensis]